MEESMIELKSEKLMREWNKGKKLSNFLKSDNFKGKKKADGKNNKRNSKLFLRK